LDVPYDPVEASDFLQQLGDAAPWGLLAYERKGKDLFLVAANPASEREMGFSISPLIGKRIEDAFPLADIGRLKEMLVQVIETGERWSEPNFRFEDPSVKNTYEVHAFRVSRSSVVSSFMDVTTRRREEAARLASEEKLRILHDTMEQGVVYQDRSGEIVSTNPAAQRILGLGAEEMKGLNSFDFKACRPDGTPFPASEHPSMITMATGVPKKAVVMGIHNPRDGSRHWISIDSQPIFREGEKEPFQVYTIFTDITERKEVEEALERERKQLRLILNSIPVGIGMTDQTGALKHVNDVAKTIWRGDLPLPGSIEAYGEFQGFWPSGEEILPEDWPLAVAVREKRVVLDVEMDIQRFDGTRGTIICSAVPVMDENGEMSGALAAYMDITRQKEVERELSSTKAKLEAVIESMPIGLRITDAAGEMVLMNGTLRRIWREDPPRTRKLVDVEREEAHLADSDIAVLQQDWPVRISLATERTAEPRIFDITRLDGTKGTVFVSGAPLMDDAGNVIGGLSFTQDITDLKLRERELKRSNEELQHFAYLASHDLQEPLRMVVGFLSLLQKKYADELDARGREYVSYAVKGGERMRTLIDDLLTYSRVDTRKEPFRAVDMNEVARQTLAVLNGAVAESGAAIQVGDLPTVKADALQMQQVLQNLLSNSIKFRGAQAPVVRVGCRETSREFVFSVQDNGIGFEPEYSERVFLMFQRLNDRNEYPGTGVGLPIAKKIVERHGGRIWAYSRPGEGSTFYFTLPKEAQ
jgi:PAS domain S-box-containing protein